MKIDNEKLNKILDAIINGINGHSGIDSQVLIKYLFNNISDNEAESYLIEISKLSNVNKYVKIVKDEFGKTVISKISTKDQAASELKSLGGFQYLIDEQNKIIEKENYKEQLETKKSELEIEKLKYEDANRELDSKIKGLTIRNLELQNLQIIYGISGAVLGFVGAFLFEHWFGLIRMLIKYLIK